MGVSLRSSGAKENYKDSKDPCLWHLTQLNGRMSVYFYILHIITTMNV